MPFTDSPAHLLEAFDEYSQKEGSMLFATASQTQSGKDLLLVKPRHTFKAWVDHKNPKHLRFADGSSQPFIESITQLEQFALTQGLTMAGYFSYEVGHCLESLPPLQARTRLLPDVYIGLYEQQAHTKNPLKKQTKQINFKCLNNFYNNQHKDQYLANIQQILKHIQAGDCYQINYAQHFSCPYQGSSYQAFKALLPTINAPFSGYINTGHGELMGFSPEQFITIDTQRNITSSPIKGTAARSLDDPILDLKRATDLQNSAKNRAENLMIVDLLRSDLGKVCKTGSIKVDELFKLTSFTNVHHLVSTISGHLKPEISPLTALLSAFPGGSITGAPKIKAMEIIQTLEPIRRSAYCGTQFYLKPDGELSSNILIRSLVAENGELHCWGGGGIVADSVPELEYQETFDKVNVFLRALEAL